MKYCPMCKKELDDTLFNRGSAQDGLQTYCRGCIKIRNRKNNPIKFEENVPDLVGECWKDIAGFENKYAVSNMGRIKSKNRFLAIKDGREVFRKGKLLKPFVNLKNGYSYVVLGYNQRSSPIHRLVGISFISNTENKAQINHINGIKTDNRAINLEWATPSENNRHAYLIGLKKPRGKKISSPLSQIKL